MRIRSKKYHTKRASSGAYRPKKKKYSQYNKKEPKTILLEITGIVKNEFNTKIQFEQHPELLDMNEELQEENHTLVKLIKIKLLMFTINYVHENTAFCDKILFLGESNFNIFQWNGRFLI